VITCQNDSTDRHFQTIQDDSELRGPETGHF
jgi:hypothetical protein